MTFIDTIKRLFSTEEKALQPYSGDLPAMQWTPYDLDVSREYEEWVDIWQKNAIVQGCVSAYALTMPEAPLSVRATDDELTREHPLITDIIRGPLTPVSEHRLWVGTYTALGIGGEAFWHKRREGKIVKGVRLLTRENVTAIPDMYGDVAYYHYRSGQNEVRIPREDIVHLTGFWIDPSKPWGGVSPIELASTSAKSYNEAFAAVYAMLKNDAVPRTVFDYKEALTSEQQAVLQATFGEKYGGKNRGKSAHIWGINQIHRLGLDMNELAVDSLTTAFEANICSTYRVHPIVAMTAAGLASSTYANFEQASKDFTTYSRVPLWDIMATQIEKGFANEYPDVDVEFDLSQVESLQPSAESERATAVTAFTAGIMTVDEAREVFGLDAGGGPATTDNEERSLVKKSTISTAVASDADDDVWVKAIDDVAEGHTDKLEGDIVKAMNNLESHLVRTLKTTTKQLGAGTDWDAWVDTFLTATLQTRTDMTEDLIAYALQDIGEDLANVPQTDYEASREVGIDESSEKISESVGTIRDEVRELARETAGLKPDEIEERLRSKFVTLKASRARAIARTTATATTGVTQKDSWERLNKRTTDPKRRIVRQWISLPGARDDHEKARGQLEDTEGNFRVGSETTPYPAGPGLSAANSVNCRCYTRARRAGAVRRS